MYVHLHPSGSRSASLCRSLAFLGVVLNSCIRVQEVREVTQRLQNEFEAAKALRDVIIPKAVEVFMGEFVSDALHADSTTWLASASLARARCSSQVSARRRRTPVRAKRKTNNSSQQRVRQAPRKALFPTKSAKIKAFEFASLKRTSRTSCRRESLFRRYPRGTLSVVR